MLRSWTIAAGAAALAALSASFALGRVTEHHQPTIASALPTANGLALAKRSELILVANMTEGLNPRLTLDRAERARAVTLARRAHAIEPLLVSPLRNLGLIAAADGDTQAARQLMLNAVRLNRRDLATNGWLIRDYGEQGKLDEALVSFDHALRTSSAGQAMLLPAMFQVMSGPQLVAPLVELLRKDPPWSDPFWREVPKYPTAIVSAAKIRTALAEEGMRGDDAPNLALLRALTQAREFASSETLFDALVPTPRTPGELLRNPGFDSAARFEPFDWRVFFESFLAAEVVNDAGILRIDTFADGSGVVARQLVALAPGTYRLAMKADDWDPLDEDALYARLGCAEKGNAAQSRDISLSRPEVAETVNVARGCRYHWLELLAREQLQRRDNTIVLDRVSLRRAGDGSES